MSGSLVPSSPTDIDLSHDGAPTAVQSWGPPAAPAAPARGALNLGRYFAALRRYKWLIAVIALLGTVGGVAATRFIKPMYRVDTAIVIGESPDPKGPVRPQASCETRRGGSCFISFAILDPVARKTGMYLTPKNEADSALFRGLPADVRPPGWRLHADREQATKKYDLAVKRGRALAVVESGTLGDSIGRTVGFAWAPDADLVAARAAGEVRGQRRRERPRPISASA